MLSTPVTIIESAELRAAHEREMEEILMQQRRIAPLLQGPGQSELMRRRNVCGHFLFYIELHIHIKYSTQSD